MAWTKKQEDYLQEISIHSLIVSRYTPRIFRMMWGEDLRNEFSSVGMTHDIGKIIQLQYFPDEYEQVMTIMRENPKLNYYKSELEMGLKDKTHSEIGAYFLKNWNLPEANCEVAHFHHMPEESSEKFEQLLKSVHITDEFVDFLWKVRKDDSWDVEEFPKLHNLSIQELNEMGNQIRVDMKNKFTFM
jgi:HD-like signal output (HDOD) protein